MKCFLCTKNIKESESRIECLDCLAIHCNECSKINVNPDGFCSSCETDEEIRRSKRAPAPSRRFLEAFRYQ